MGLFEEDSGGRFRETLRAYLVSITNNARGRLTRSGRRLSPSSCEANGTGSEMTSQKRSCKTVLHTYVCRYSDSTPVSHHNG